VTSIKIEFIDPHLMISSLGVNDCLTSLYRTIEDNRYYGFGFSFFLKYYLGENFMVWTFN